jgi:hypothetical protein
VTGQAEVGLASHELVGGVRTAYVVLRMTRSEDGASLNLAGHMGGHTATRPPASRPPVLSR